MVVDALHFTGGGADGFCLPGFFGLWGMAETSLGAENFVTLIKRVVKLVNGEKVPKNC